MKPETRHKLVNTLTALLSRLDAPFYVEATQPDLGTHPSPPTSPVAIAVGRVLGLLSLLFDGPLPRPKDVKLSCTELAVALREVAEAGGYAERIARSGCGSGTQQRELMYFVYALHNAADFLDHVAKPRASVRRTCWCGNSVLVASDQAPRGWAKTDGKYNVCPYHKAKRVYL